MSQKILRKSVQKASITHILAFIIAAGVAVVVCVAFFSCLSLKKVTNNRIVLNDKINPNHASLESLVRLPGIGLSRANAVIAYRCEFLKEYPRRSAFTYPNDLQKVKGIGPKTVETIIAYIRFETDEF